MPQNQKTEAIEEIDAADLPHLTEKQMAFVIGICEGKTLIDSYKSAGYAVDGWSRNAVQVEASRLRASPNVSLWISALKRQQFARGVYTKEMHLAELDALAEEAKSSGNYGAAVNACKAKGQVEGHYVSFHEDLTKRSRSPAEMIQEIEAKLGKEAADVLAKSMGVERLNPAEMKAKTA